MAISVDIWVIITFMWAGKVYLGLANEIILGIFLVIYIATIKLDKDTLGSALVRLRISSMGDDDMGVIRSSWRAVLLFSVCFFVSIAHIILDKIRPDNDKLSLIIGASVIVINFLPAFFTERRLAIHDILSRSFTELDHRIVKASHKLAVWGIFLFFVILQFALHKFHDSKMESCHDLYIKKEFQQVVDDCSKFSKKAQDAYLDLWVGYSQLQVKNYDEAINSFNSSEEIGYEPSSYLAVFTHIKKQDHDQAIEIAEERKDDAAMSYLASSAYLAKFEKTDNIEDLKRSVAHFKLMSQQMKDIKTRDAVRNHILETDVVNDHKDKLDLASQRAKIKEEARKKAEQEAKEKQLLDKECENQTKDGIMPGGCVRPNPEAPKEEKEEIEKETDDKSL